MKAGVSLEVQRGPAIAAGGIGFTIWLFNIAMENGPFIDGLPIKNCDFPDGTILTICFSWV